MGMIAFVMERCVPAKVIGWDFHRLGNVIPVGAKQIAPYLCIVIAQSSCILPMQRDNVRPHIAGVVLQFRHSLIQIHMIFVTEQTVRAESLHARAGCNVIHVCIRLLDGIPLVFQCRRDNYRGVNLVGVFLVLIVLVGSFQIRKVIHQLCDELFLLTSGRTIIRYQFHAITGRDVL